MSKSIIGWITPTDERFLCAEFENIMRRACGKIIAADKSRLTPYGAQVGYVCKSASLLFESHPENGETYVSFVATNKSALRAFKRLARLANMMPVV